MMLQRISKDHKQAKFAFDVLKLKEASMKTLIVGSSTIVKCKNAREEMKEMVNLFHRLDLWKEWSVPLHSNAKFSDSSTKLLVGTKFSQTLNLGFPMGQMVSNEQVALNDCTDNESKIMWSKDEGGVSSCHFWSFECLDSNRVEVSNIEVFHGVAIILVKGLVSNRWNELFEKSLTGFVEHYSKSHI